MSAGAPAELSCQELVELVTEYLEAKLPVAERTRFETHLVWCPPCRTYLAQMRETMRVAGRLSEAAVPDDAKRELLAAFKRWKTEGGGS
jgi:anti-sigma factor RsiW